MLKKQCGIVISSLLIVTFFAISNSNGSGSLLTQKALAQDDNNKTAAATTNNMTKAGSTMIMGNKTTANADTLMTKIRNMGNASVGSGGGSSVAINMTNASAASNVMMGNKSG
jgi:hypothetical protein